MNTDLRLIITYAPLCATAFVRLCGAGPLYQIMKTKDSSKHCPLPFISMIFGCILGSYYAYLVSNPIVFISSLTGIASGFIFFSIYLVYATQEARFHYVKIFAYSSVVEMMYVCTPFIVSIKSYAHYIGFGTCFMAVVTMSSPLASLQRVIKEGTTQSMSFIVSLAMTTNGTVWTIYGFVILHGNLFIVVPNLLGSAAGFLQLFLFCLYPSKDMNTGNNDDANYKLRQPLLAN